jgi:amidase
MMDDLHYATLLDVAAKLRARELSPVELTEAMLTRIERLAPSLHAYAVTTPELALRQAKSVSGSIAELIEHGRSALCRRCSPTSIHC